MSAFGIMLAFAAGFVAAGVGFLVLLRMLFARRSRSDAQEREGGHGVASINRLIEGALGAAERIVTSGGASPRPLVKARNSCPCKANAPKRPIQNPSAGEIYRM